MQPLKTTSMSAYPAATSLSCAFYSSSSHHSSPIKLVRFSRSRCKFTLDAASAAFNVIQTAPAQESSSQTPAESIPRRLILLRHAESSWENPSLRDHDRPLSKSGQVDAAKVSQKLHLLGWIPELILSSDARRTKETLKVMQNEVPGLLNAEIHFLSSFYSVAAMDGQTAEHLQRSICEYSRSEIVTIMCMGHNKGWEEAAAVFSGVSVELKTCNAALLEAIGESWEEAFCLAGFGGWRLHAIVQP